jgi:hypothetical protein
MAASYPAAIKTFSAITLGATVLEQVLFDDMVAEIEAIEAELGINCHGSMGSLAERVNLALDWDGGSLGMIGVVNATDAQGRRMRCGVEQITSDQLTAYPATGTAYSGHYTINFSPAFSSGSACIAFCELQLIESDPTLPGIASFICQWGSGTSSSFTIQVNTKQPRIPDAGTSFMVHWIAIEDTSTSLATL